MGKSSAPKLQPCEHDASLPEQTIVSSMLVNFSYYIRR